MKFCFELCNTKFIGYFSLCENIVKTTCCIVSLVILEKLSSDGVFLQFHKEIQTGVAHDVIYIIFGLFGLLSSILLIRGTYIWWISYQGISIAYQLYFSSDIIYKALKHNIQSIVISSLIIVACFWFFVEAYIFYVIIRRQRETEQEILAERNDEILTNRRQFNPVLPRLLMPSQQTRDRLLTSEEVETTTPVANTLKPLEW